MEIAKALILAGSTSSERPWPSVAGGPKQLVPVANRPILFHNLEALRQAGVIEAMIVVEPHAAAAIRAAVGDGSDWGLGVRYLEWAPATRLREALAAAGDYVADEPVLVEHADALMRHHLHGHLADFARERLDAVAFRLLRAPRNGDGEPMAGGYLFSRRATAILRASNVADDPLEGVQAYGGRVRTLDVEGCLACHGGQDALLEGNRSMLEHLTTSVDAASLLEASEIQGPVVVHPNRASRAHARARPGDHRTPLEPPARLRRSVHLDRRRRRDRGHRDRALDRALRRSPAERGHAARDQRDRTWRDHHARLRSPERDAALDRRRRRGDLVAARRAAPIGSSCR